jgi:hypothetical protein
MQGIEAESQWLMDSFCPEAAVVGNGRGKIHQILACAVPPSPHRQTLLRMPVESPKIGVQKFSKILKALL